MGLESIKNEFNKRVNELELLNKKIAQKQHEKAHIGNEILHLERLIRDLEIRLKTTVKREKKLEKIGSSTEKDIGYYKNQVRKLLAELDKIRLSIG